MGVIGKVIGFFIGAFSGNPIIMVLALFIGHLFDNGTIAQCLNMTQSGFAGYGTVRETFFNTTFTVMGFLAKSDGHVSQREIDAATRVMNHMRLNPALKKEAIRLFNLGKQSNFNIAQAITALRQACVGQPNLLSAFIEIQMQMAYADGIVTPGKKAALQSIYQLLGLGSHGYDQFEQRHRAEQNYQRHRQQSPHNPNAYLDDAYQILGVTREASNAEIKKAYRRLMSQHHPDKLIAKGLPREMIDVATKKAAQISKAYETIKETRGIK